MIPQVSERAIILAPRGRDAEIAGQMLTDVRIESVVAHGLPDFVDKLSSGVGFAIVTDEAIRRSDLKALDGVLQAQEEWSDLPFILLTERGGSIERNPAAVRFLELLGNVTFLERPFHPTTLVSIARAALRARRRQYDARARLLAIREGEAQLRIAFSAGRLGAWSLDVASMTLNASDECKRHYGRGVDEVFGYQDLLDSIHSDDRPAMISAVQAALRSGSDYDIEYRCVWPDQTIHWAQVRGRPEMEGGDAVRMTGVSLDITERKTAEEQLRNFALELERRVDERTREREAVTAQLHEAQKLETLGQLTGGVAHDFNNLLTPIVGSLDMARRRTSDPKLLKVIEGGLQSSERARILVARLLSFARRQNLETRPTDVASLIAGMEDLIRRSIGPTIALQVDLEENISAAMVDPNQLELALLNLAINARDAMPDGGRLTIAASGNAVPSGHARLVAGDYVCVRVADTGIGMGAETLAKAVEPFYSTKGVGKGTGLGLSMVHGLAAQSGGELTLSSTIGAGTTAELWLPAASIAAVAPRPAPEDLHANGASLNVLLVDDDDGVREATATMLQDLGHAVVEADSGAAALTLVRSRPFDILVTDYLMPGMSGIDLAREVRKIRADFPVLMATGFADLAEESAADVARIAKPFRISELAGALKDVCEPMTI